MEKENKGSNKFSLYIKDSIEELKKVKWPSKNDTINHTILVIVICLVMGLFLGLLDFGLTEILYKLLNIVR